MFSGRPGECVHTELQNNSRDSVARRARGRTAGVGALFSRHFASYFMVKKVKVLDEDLCVSLISFIPETVMCPFHDSVKNAN